MGNCFTKPERPIQTSRSNSFTNVKFSTPAASKKETVENGFGGVISNSRQPQNQVTKPNYSSDNVNSPNVPPVKCVATGNSLYNSLYNEQSSPYKQRRAECSSVITRNNKSTESAGSNTGGGDVSSSSYRLKQEDLCSGSHVGHMGTSSDFSIASNYSPGSSKDSSRQNTLENYSNNASQSNHKLPDRVVNPDQHKILRGHKRTDSSDRIKVAHIRTGSAASIISRDRSDSTHKRFQTDLIRKGSWTVNEPKVQRSDSDHRQQPDVTRFNMTRNESHPRILTDHIEPNVGPIRNMNSHYENTSINAPQVPLSPLTRSDSCKNELNPVLRNKGSSLHERRQVVSAMHIDLSAVSNSTTSSEEEGSPLQVNRRISESLQNECESVIKWKKGNLLGKGSFGKVYSAMTNDGQIVAVKQIELDSTNWSQAEADYKLIQREVDIQKTLDHPNIVKFLDCGLDVAEFTVNILMEHVSGGTIASLLKKFGTFDESVFQRYTSQLIDATTYLHSNNVIHRDIKGSNIMVTTTGCIKLIDFGTAKRTTDDLITPLSAMKLDFCIKGTPYWMAPEVVQMAGDPTSKADVWSIGCTVIEMATGSPPYFHMQPMSALFVIGSLEKPSPKLPEQFSPEARDFVDKCLDKVMQKRPTSAELGRHPFILREFIKRYPDNRRFYI